MTAHMSMTAAARQQSSVSRPHYWAAGALPAQARLAHSGSLRYGLCRPGVGACFGLSVCLSSVGLPVFCLSVGGTTFAAQQYASAAKVACARTEVYHQHGQARLLFIKN